MSSNVSLLRETSRQVVAGASAGLVEICLMHPLDVVKTRLQVQRSVMDPQSYKSVRDCFRTVFRTEGFLGFYKGIVPPILAETPKRAVKFSTFEQYKKLLEYMSLSPGLTFAVAGFGSGLTEAIVVNPFEVVKVGLQVNRNMFTEDPTLEILRKFGIGFVSGTMGSVFNIPFDVAKSRIQGPQPVPGEIKYRSCLKTILTVYREEGILALYKGLLPKVMRLGPGGAVMLLVYEHVHSWLQEKW
ncbi:mitochondrial 2-oxodicarboxylate carrier isoform X3 [Psammomys obesus]|uniref:mitochondrial 2-oxodicarboxylate carrier isoform X3 n=1 Tax=Psammomys obesus TaxID=48139 RepID=UPI0024532BF8|nr:mitochondrial 2-oxodicarboxylate carrier isoform X3 [Psammomys obesus]